MFRFEPPTFDRGVLYQLKVNGEDIIMPWGIEFADSSAFFSLEDGFGYRYKLLEEHESVSASTRKVIQVIRMQEGLVRLELSEWIDSPTEIRRTAQLTCLEDTTLMDFVMRFRFTGRFRVGYINDQVIPYRNSHIYHQFPVDTAALGDDDYTIRVTVIDRLLPDSMRGFMYLRDGEGYWVLHVRMLPQVWDKEVIKLCTRWFQTKPIPTWLSRPLLSIPGVKRALWYRGERKPYRNPVARLFSPNAYPMVRLREGQVLRWDVKCCIENPIPLARASEKLCL